MPSKSIDERHIEKWIFKDPETAAKAAAMVRAYKARPRGYVPSAWGLPADEREAINAMYIEMAAEIEGEMTDAERWQLMTKLEMVQEFHRKHNIRLDPQMDNEQIADLRFRLIQEELREFGEALDANDKVEVADALGDLLYVIYGAADVYGIDIDRVFTEIHRSNMTKVSTPEASTKIHKIQKGPDYSPPDLKFVVSGASNVKEHRQ